MVLVKPTVGTRVDPVSVMIIGLTANKLNEVEIFDDKTRALVSNTDIVTDAVDVKLDVSTSGDVAGSVNVVICDLPEDNITDVTVLIMDAVVVGVGLKLCIEDVGAITDDCVDNKVIIGRLPEVVV
jgi:hypothetical protein